MYHLFEVFGIELEYMIVDRDTLRVRPIADELIFKMTGTYTSDVERGDIAWSNELVSHVLELKTNGPAKSLEGLADRFMEEVTFINEQLAPMNAMLLPSGAHPLFDPETETVLWPHEHNEVYELYNRIFGCKGHGWSNLQSTHVNLPFANDEEFAALHAAIRVLLPIIPALSASTPVIGGEITGFVDTRLEYYRKNQQKIPVIGGLVVPEPVFSHAEYERSIFRPISEAIAPYDTERVLDKHFLNSRGAIARFDRGAIEIRVIDIQECPKADLALVTFIVASIRWLIRTYANDPVKLQTSCTTEELASIMVDAARQGSQYVVNNLTFLGLFGISEPCNLRTVWQVLYEHCWQDLNEEAQYIVRNTLAQGNLSERILQHLSTGATEADIKALYRALSACLANNQLFVP